MRKANILKIALSKNLDMETTIIFLEFISKRFPDESDNITSYVSEWADRFKSDSPEKFMDAQSLQIYNEVKEVEQ